MNEIERDAGNGKKGCGMGEIVVHKKDNDETCRNHIISKVKSLMFAHREVDRNTQGLPVSSAIEAHFESIEIEPKICVNLLEI